ncbi:MAG: YCF48-related protein [Saprospiraceae bacterium]
MTKFILLSLLSALFCFQAAAQNWYSIDDLAFGSRYDDIVFVTPSIAFAGSGEGRIVKSTDGGLNWETVFLDREEYIRSIDFIDENRGFAGSLTNKLFATTDGGDTWEDITTRLPAGTPGFCGLSHIGDTVFAAGIYSSPAVFARSFDAGLTWEVSDLDSLANGFAEVEFVTPERGFLAGTKGADGATLLVTEDGGDTWREVFGTNDPLEYVWKLFFLTDQDVYASIESFGDETSMIISSDGGTTWEEKVVSAQGLDIQGIAFTSKDTGWVSPRSIPGFETFDGGETWERNASIPGNINRAVFRPDSTLFAAGATVFYFADEEIVSSLVDRTFNPSTTLSLVNTIVSNANVDLTVSLKKSSNVRIDVLSTNGQFVESIFSGRMPIGVHALTHHLTSSMSAGSYIITLRSDDNFQAEKIVKVN